MYNIVIKEDNSTTNNLITQNIREDYNQNIEQESLMNNINLIVKRVECEERDIDKIIEKATKLLHNMDVESTEENKYISNQLNNDIKYNNYAMEYEIDQLEPKIPNTMIMESNISKIENKRIIVDKNMINNIELQNINCLDVRIEGLRALNPNLINQIYTDNIYIILKIPLKSTEQTNNSHSNYDIMKVKCPSKAHIMNKNIYSIKSGSQFAYNINEQNLGCLIQEYFILEVVDTQSNEIIGEGNIPFQSLLLANHYKLDNLVKIFQNDNNIRKLKSPTKSPKKIFRGNIKQQQTPRKSRITSKINLQNPSNVIKLDKLEHHNTTGKDIRLIHIADIRIIIQLLVDNYTSDIRPKIPIKENIYRKYSQEITHTHAEVSNQPLFLLIDIKGCKDIDIYSQQMNFKYPEEQKLIFPNVFIQYKDPINSSTYNTEIAHNTNNPQFMHTIQIPLLYSKIKDPPNHQIFEVWNRPKDIPRNQLIGLVKLSFKVALQGNNICNNGIENILNSNETHVIINGLEPIISPGSGKCVGYLNLTICIGNINQISKFMKQNITNKSRDRSNQDTERNTPTINLVNSPPENIYQSKDISSEINNKSIENRHSKSMYNSPNTPSELTYIYKNSQATSHNRHANNTQTHSNKKYIYSNSTLSPINTREIASPDIECQIINYTPRKSFHPGDLRHSPQTILSKVTANKEENSLIRGGVSEDNSSYIQNKHRKLENRFKHHSFEDVGRGIKNKGENLRYFNSHELREREIGDNRYTSQDITEHNTNVENIYSNKLLTHKKHIFGIEIIEIRDFYVDKKLDLWDEGSQRNISEQQNVSNITVRYSFPFEQKTIQTDYIMLIADDIKSHKKSMYIHIYII